ncbi:hypothetical protein, partial [Sulfuricurvum sp.]|uniref:hypothetical protein n=1 Tax=Sulfuricurvum sp. TaxID=2025608 RepID=UPI0035668B3A
MNRLFILFFTLSCFATQRIPDSLWVLRGIRTEGTMSIKRVPFSTSPESLLVRDAGSNETRSYPFTFDSVRAAHKADSSGKADSSRVSGTSYGFIHGVTNQYIPHSTGVGTLGRRNLFWGATPEAMDTAALWYGDGGVRKVIFVLFTNSGSANSRNRIGLYNYQTSYGWYGASCNLLWTKLSAGGFTGYSKFSIRTITDPSPETFMDHISIYEQTGQVVFNDSLTYYGAPHRSVWPTVKFKNYRNSDSLMIENMGSYSQEIIKVCTSTDSFATWKRTSAGNELMQMSGSTLRTVIGAATPQQISDSLANKVIGVGTRYFMPVWSGTPTTHTLSNSSLLNLGSALMNIGVASSMQLINTSESESSCNLIFNNADTKYYGGGVYLTYHKLQDDSGYSHFEIRSYSSAGKYLTFLRIDEQGGLNLNHADYDDTRNIPAMTVDNGGIHVDDTIWTDVGTSKCLSMFNSDGAIINSGISDSGNVLSFLDSISIHLRNWSSGTGYFLIGDQSIDSGSYFKMYNKVSGGNTVIQNKNGIGLLTPGSYVVAEDDFHTQYNEEGVAYVNGAKSLRTITAIDSNELKVLDGAVDTFTVVDSLFDGGTFRTASTAAVYKIGRMVTVSFCNLTGTVT